jgi:methyl-accepting chemotaxis protein
MSWFYKLSARAKLIAAFLLVSVILSSVSVTALVKMGSINNLLSGMYNKDLLGIMSAKQANLNMLCIGREVLRAYSQTDKAAIEASGVKIDEYAKIFLEEIDAVDKIVESPNEKVAVAKIKDSFLKYVMKDMEAIKLCLAGKTEEAHNTLKDAKTVADEVDKGCTDLAKAMQISAKQDYDVSRASYESAFLLVIIMVAVGTTLGRALGWLIANWFTKALLAVSAIADSVASSSHQLAAAAEELSTGAQEQASSLEETASSLEQITGTIQQNADNAQQANQLAVNSREVAEKGGDVVGRAVHGMGEINTSSKKISDIIAAIDEIAFQTNLLALNAAVEAARAGEQGRGFAVVAGEVRNLAQRSAAAAKEIKSLIQDSVSKVDTGTKLVDQSGQTLNEIVTSVKRVTDIVSEIAAASREQASGIEQVNKAVSQMDQVTQGNASQTEELSGTAESLSSQAAQLQQLVAQFNLVKRGRSTDHRVVNQTPSNYRPVKQTAGTGKKNAHAKQQAQAGDSLEHQIHQEIGLIGAGIGDNGHKGFEEF